MSGYVRTDITLTGLSSENTLTFTTSSWGTAQTVTVKADQDDDAGNDSITLVHTAADGGYDDVTADLPVTVDDDETPNLVLSRSSLTVDEGDSTDVDYTVQLATPPTRSVTVTVTGHGGTDLTLTGLSTANTLTFTTFNWDTAQTVTVKAGEDDDAGNDSVTLVHTAAGGEYAGVTADLVVTVDDDETTGLVLSKPSLTVGEGDTTGVSYTIKLATQPSDEVTVTVSGHSGTDLSLDETTLTFTTSTWDTAQTVTVKASSDNDGTDDSVTLTHTAAGGDYADVTAELHVTVSDDDRSIVLSKSSLTVGEGDATGVSYTVKLATQPSEEITVTVTGHVGTDLTLNKTTLTFTTDTWDTAQSVTVKAGQDGDGADDSVTLTHTATGGDYEGLTASLPVTVSDDDRSIVLSKSFLTVGEGDITGENYTVRLASQPSEEVTVTISGHLGTDLSLNKTTLTFTTSDWAPQSITVKAGQDDDGADDPVTLTHTAAGGEYADVTATLPVTVSDDDRGIVLTPATLTVDEGDTAGVSYTVKLATQPSEEITVTVTGHSGTEVNLTGLSNSNTLTFTTENWETAQSVTVKAGQDEDGADDSVTLTHTAAGGEYAGMTEDLAVTVDDDETPSLALSKTSLTVDEGDATGETYTVKLAIPPTEEVTVTVSGHSGTDLTLTGLSTTNTLTFTTENWETAQTVTVKAGQDDDGADGTVTLTHTAAGGEYADVTATLPVTVSDDDRSIVLTPATLTVDEGDATGATYTVKLATQPSEEITVTVTGHVGTDLTLNKTTLTFTTDTWDTAQSVTVKAGQDDDGADDAVTLTHTAAGGDYAGAASPLSVTVDDDETPSLALSKTSLTVDEGDATGETYTVKLAIPPTEEVTVTVSGHSGTDLTLTGLSTTNTLTFTTENWETAQTVTVKAGQDPDGADDPVTLTHTAAGGEYADVTATLPVTVSDDDRSIVLTPASLTVDEGDATGATYTVKLATQPSEEITVTVTGHVGTDLTLNKTTLTFTTDSPGTRPRA